MQNRRDFIKNGLFAGSGVLLLPHFISAQLVNYGSSVGLQGLTPFVIMDKCASLTTKSSTISLRTKNALNASIFLDKPANLSRISMVVPQKKKFILQSLQEVKDNLDNQEEAEFWDKKHAFTLGWLMTYAASNILYPALKQVAGKDTKKRLEAQLYHDTELLRGSVKVAKRLSDKDEIFSFFMAMFPRMITRVHTLEPDLDDGAGWVVRMTRWRRKNKELMEKYAQVYTRPDMDKREKYVYDINFYDDADKIFDFLFHDTLAYKGEKYKNKSLVAKALNNAFQNIYFADNYFAGKISKQELETKLV